MRVDWRQGDWAVTCDSAGGRLVQVWWRGRELLTEPHLPGGQFTPPDPQWGEYETRPVCGYDDCWPSLEASLWPGCDRMVRDHGELCWLEWSICAAETLRATATDPAGQWAFTRELSVAGGALRFGFTCSNTGATPLSMGWAGHTLVPPDAVLGLALPACDGITWAWPPEARPDGAPACAHEVWPFLRSREGQATMLVLARCHAPEVTIRLPGARWTMRTEGLMRPSLGLWHNAGAYPPEPGLQRRELGVEWMLTPECLLEEAFAAGNATILAPQQRLRWALIWTLEEYP